MIITKITKRKYEVINAVNHPFMKFGTFRKIRERLGLSIEKCCFNCNHKFKDDEYIYLVIVKGTHNRLLCKDCNDKACDDLKQANINK